ncbi:hypothetical protein ACJ41O_014621 [Fusarium nematophilum]
MPFYQVYHSYPLNFDQRQSLATSITTLHCTAFNTPAFFVHVRFIKEAVTDGTYFLAGKPRDVTSNRIVGLVRGAEKRPRVAFDALAAEVEEAWYRVLDLVAPAVKESWDAEDEARRLLKVTFLPMVTMREGGMALPGAGEEGTWLRRQMGFFNEMSDKGIDDFTELLKELERRDQERLAR